VIEDETDFGVYCNLLQSIVIFSLLFVTEYSFRPAMYMAIRTGSVEATVDLGMDVDKIAKAGCKLTKENMDKLISDLTEALGSVPPDTPVVLFFLDNSSFMGLSEEGRFS
jgi:hypothetical protein